MKKQRKHYTPEEKGAIPRRHLLDKEPISKLCDELGLQPTVFYRWQKEFFENGAAAFQQKARPNHSVEQERIPYLEKKMPTAPGWNRSSAGCWRLFANPTGTPMTSRERHPCYVSVTRQYPHFRAPGRQSLRDLASRVPGYYGHRCVV